MRHQRRRQRGLERETKSREANHMIRHGIFQSRPKKGLRDRNSPRCTLSQNGYGTTLYTHLLSRTPGEISLKCVPVALRSGTALQAEEIKRRLGK